MHEAVILGRRHGASQSEPREIVSGPTFDFPSVKAEYKALVLAKSNADYSEIEFGFFVGEKKARLAPIETPKQTTTHKKKKSNNENL